MVAEVCSTCTTSFTASSRQSRTSLGAALGALAAHPATGFFERVARGFRLIGVSWRALRLDPELMVFPFVAGVLTFLAFAMLFSLLHGIGFSNWTEETLLELPKWEIWLFYAMTYFIGVFCQAGVVACATMRFDGHDPRLSDGVAAATRRAVPLAGWAIVAATVALFLRWLENFVAGKAGRAGRVAVGMIDIAWRVATYFAVPVILFEDAGPFRAVKRSGHIFKRNWRETFAGTLGMGLAWMIVYILLLLLTVGLALFVGMVAVYIGIAAYIGLAVVSFTLSGIYNAALYRYAVMGEPPVPFSYADVGGRTPIPPPVPAGA
jgi:hypothetical protein